MAELGGFVDELAGGEIRFLRSSHAGTLHRLLGLCPDEIVPRVVPRLTFIVDDKLRESIARDVDSLEGFLREGEWKAVTVIGGSLVEALLFDKLLNRKISPVAKRSRRSKMSPTQGAGRLSRWKTGSSGR